MRSLILLFIAIASNAAASDRVLSQACGSISPELAISIVDQDTNIRVAGATITFFSNVDQIRIREIEAMRKSGSKESPTAPKGTVVCTDSKGRAKLRCTFSNTKIIFASGTKRNETYPEGQFQFECAGYLLKSLSAKELYPDEPYLAALQPTSVVMEKTSNQPSGSVSANRVKAP